MTDQSSTAPLRWRDVAGMLAAAGFPLRREPPPPSGAMASHRAEWFTAGRLEDGDRVWIRVLHYPDTLPCRWQVTAYRASKVYLGPLAGERDLEQHRVLLHDPTPLEAFAAAAVLGIAPSLPAPIAPAATRGSAAL